MHRTPLTRLLIVALAWSVAVVASAQLAQSPLDLDHPAVAYGSRPTTDRVALLNERLQSGETSLRFDTRTGYLKSLLDALDVRIDSQIAVFSKTIFFNDSVAVAWVRGGFIEIAAHDPQQGAVFYRLLEAPTGTPLVLRDNRCLQCHFSYDTLGVPGFLARSIPSATDGSTLPWLGNYLTDHRSPLEERWAGWYVTGSAGSSRHLGNAPVRDKTIQDVRVQDRNLNLSTLFTRFDTTAYLSPLSDVVALLVFDHQVRMMNLLTRIGWEARKMAHEGRTETAIFTTLRDTAAEAADYLVFVDEAPLTGARGTSGFAEAFSARGPRDSKGRSLRDLDLTRRLLQYPCSYMIYSEAFDQLPRPARLAIYWRMWQVLSGADPAPKYARLSQADRQAMIEILRETKKDLPDFFTPRPSQP